MPDSTRATDETDAMETVAREFRLANALYFFAVVDNPIDARLAALLHEQRARVWDEEAARFDAEAKTYRMNRNLHPVFVEEAARCRLRAQEERRRG